jgi:ribosomal protein S18 acetylase RimI-like enzyme
MDNLLKIRDYLPNDFSDIMDLWRLVDMAGKERADSNDSILRTVQNGGKFIIMEINGKIIGTSWMTHDFRRSYLHHFCVHPNEQSKGYGNILMEESMKFLKEMSYQVKLEVHKENYKALNLYRKFGFIDFPDYEPMMNRTLIYK